MKDLKNEFLNKEAAENLVAGVLDAAALTDEVIAGVSGGIAEENTGNDSTCH